MLWMLVSEWMLPRTLFRLAVVVTMLVSLLSRS